MCSSFYKYLFFIYNPMKHIMKFNESLRDKMIPKELDDKLKNIYDFYELCDEIGFGTTKIINSDGIYWFDINNIKDMKFRISYNSKVNENNWEIYNEIFSTNNGKDKRGVYKFDNSNDLVIKLIELTYGDIDEIIRKVNNNIEQYKWSLKSQKIFKNKLEKAKEIYYGGK